MDGERKREEEEKGEERNIVGRETHKLVASHTHPNQDGGSDLQSTYVPMSGN